MRILFVHNTYRYAGGEDVAVKQEIELLEKNGHRVELVTFHNEVRSGIISKIKFASSSLYNRNSYKRLQKKIETFEPDIAHVHNFFFEASPSIFFILKKKKVPVVLTLHNYRLVCANALLLRNNAPCELCVSNTIPLSGIKYKCYHDSSIESAIVTGIASLHKILHTWTGKVDRYIALTEFSKTILYKSSLKLNKQKITVKPNFVFDKQAGQQNRDDFFLFVGRIATEKGVDNLLKVFGNNPGIRLVMIGGGPEKERLQGLYSSYKNIVFEGQRDKEEVLHYMKKAKALVFPSIWYEGLPFTIIEAFSTGTPVIASNLGSMAELINHNYNGFLFNYKDLLSLQSVLLDFDNLTKTSDIYSNSRKTYLEKYTPEKNLAAMLSIYNEVISINAASANE